MHKLWGDTFEAAPYQTIRVLASVDGSPSSLFLIIWHSLRKELSLLPHVFDRQFISAWSWGSSLNYYNPSLSIFAIQVVQICLIGALSIWGLYLLTSSPFFSLICFAPAKEPAISPRGPRSFWRRVVVGSEVSECARCGRCALAPGPQQAALWSRVCGPRLFCSLSACLPGSVLPCLSISCLLPVYQDLEYVFIITVFME